MHLFQAQAIEVIYQVLMLGTVDLIDGKEDRLMGAAKKIGQFLVPGQQAVLPGDHENNPVRVFNRPENLGPHLLQEQFIFRTVEASRVHEGERGFSPVHAGIKTIPGHSGLIVHQSIP